MWIFTTDGFLSAVRDNLEPGNVLVRFRSRAHAERILLRAYPGSRGRRPEIQETPPPKDYRWKISMPSGRFNILLANLSEELMQYDNFKDACHRKHPDDRTPLTRVWGVMNDMQRDEVYGQHDPAGIARLGHLRSHKGQRQQEREDAERHTYTHDDETLGEFDLGQGMTDVAELVTWADRTGVPAKAPRKPAYCEHCANETTAVRYRKRWACFRCGSTVATPKN